MPTTEQIEIPKNWDKLNNMEQIAWFTVNVPPVMLDSFCTQLTNEQKQKFEKMLESMATHAAGNAAYIGERHGYGCGDQGHESGVKKLNKVTRAVRKAFGYDTTGDLSF